MEPRHFWLQFLLGAGLLGLLLTLGLDRTPGRGLLERLGLLLLAGFNFAGYVILGISLIIVLVEFVIALRAHGRAVFRRWLQTAALYRHTGFGRHRRRLWRAYGIGFALLALLGFGAGFRWVAGIGAFGGATFLFNLFHQAAPPVILFLGTSSPRALELLERLRSAVFWRVAALLDTGAAPDPLLARYLRLDDFRTSDSAQWRDQVRALREITRLTVLDTEATTEGVLFEVGLVFQEQPMDSVLFVRDRTGRVPALAHAAATGGRSTARDAWVQYVDPDQLDQAVGSLIYRMRYGDRVPSLAHRARVADLCEGPSGG